MAMRIIKPIFTFRRTQDQASSWNVFVEHLNGAHADDAWRSVVDAWIDGSLLRWLERQRPDTAARVKGLGTAGEPPVFWEQQKKLAIALFGDLWPEGIRMAMDTDEKEQKRIEEEKRFAEEKIQAEEKQRVEERLRGVASPGEDWTVILPGGVKLEMVWVAPGTFMKWYNEEDPVHQVTLTKGYWIGKYQFTQEQWEAVFASPSDSNCWNGKRLPVESVRWDGAVGCCKTLSGQLWDKLPSGYRFALPTEAQWEFAAQGGVKSRGYDYSGSNNIDEVAWFDGNSGGRTHEVGQKKPNELGIYDMSGNVWEWCSNWKGARLSCGGSWRDDAGSCHWACSSYTAPVFYSSFFGFRVALVPVK